MNNSLTFYVLGESIKTKQFFLEFYLVFLLVNILKSNPPITPPYKEAFKGLDVIGQVPVEQPMK
jgi:hypothetical protein